MHRRSKITKAGKARKTLPISLVLDTMPLPKAQMTGPFATAAVEAQGFAFLEQLSPDSSTEQIAQGLGTLVALSEKPAVHELRPKRRDEASPNSYSALYGVDAFPLHTDFAHWHVPPRFLLLRCMIGCADVATTLVDTRPIVQTLGKSLLARALMKPRRPLRGRLSLLPLLNEHPAPGLFRWDERFLLPASQMGRKCAREVKAMFVDAAVDEVCLRQRGDTLLIDNWKMLHGRSLVPQHGMTRVVERVYLKDLL